MGVTKKEINTELSIKRLNQHSLKLRMIGRTPLYFNSMSAKAQRDLLIGAKKKTAAEKQLIKHNPENEFRSSMHTQETGDTLLCFPAMGVKGAMATAALETDGIKKNYRTASDFSAARKYKYLGHSISQNGCCQIGRYEQDAGRSHAGLFTKLVCRDYY